MVAKFSSLSAALLCVMLLASCASAPSPGGRVGDYASVRVAAGVTRDFQRSLEYLRAQDYAEAIELLQSVVEREQRLPAPYVNLGIAYYKSGLRENAQKAFLRALEIEPQHPVATNELAVLYRKQGEFEQARSLYVSALAKHPDYGPLIKNLGILCDLYLQDVPCALAQFQHYLQLQPEDKDVTIWVADLNRRTGQ
ncbi:tetratricopeptide repeat protein [Microbulbifer sp. 2201CG32-9]|uniref:tetratricopeptide repeat protein n=1 Tax=Microbulbifer sp. 2201CG32-9 TaxID=3232309 RepID=UPI00345C33C2